MTNESISGFLNSIAEAKRAFDQEPVYVRQIQDLEADKKRLGDTVAHRELRIHELKQNEETLTQKLRSVEAERDDAGFRALEEADKVQNLLVTLRGFIGDGLKVLSAVEGKESVAISRDEHQGLMVSVGLLEDANRELKDELQSLRNEMTRATEQLQRPFDPEGSDMSSSNEGTTDPSSSESDKWRGSGNTEWQFPDSADLMKRQSEVDPTTAPTPNSAEPQEVTSALSAPLGLTEGQRVADPTLTNVINGEVKSEQTSALSSAPQDATSHEGQSEGPFASQGPTQSETASSGTASASTDAPSSASPPERNRDRSTFFTGRKYFDVTYFVPLHQWLNEGGTREDYYWRPAEGNVALPQANNASRYSS